MENKKTDSSLKAGKVDPEILQRFFLSLPSDDSVIVGPGIGEDAAVISVDRKYLVVKTDPVTFTSRNLGWYVVNINANDIACMGGIPRWFLVSLLLPPGEKEEFLKEFFSQLSKSCKKLKISLIGGHTEITPAVKRAVVVGQMIGELKKDRPISNTGAQIGDTVLLTKGLAIEGTHVIYQEKKEELEKEIPPEILKRISHFLESPGISVVREAAVATENVDVHCLHDPTEGGLIAGIWEIASASGVGIQLNQESIPIFKETELLCQRYNLEPLNLLASGALLIVSGPKETQKLSSIYRKMGIRCAEIGRVVPPEKGITIVKKGESFSVLSSPKDELTKLFKEEKLWQKSV
jgi:thiamin-phosphate kinase